MRNKSPKSLTYAVKIFAIILFVSIASRAQNAYVDSLLKAGNRAFQSKNFEKAVDNYEKILDEGYESSELYYNLGNAYYKLGALGKAILNYERALKLDPGNEDARYNLQIANAHISDKINPVPKFFLTEWKEDLLEFFEPQTLAVIVSVLFALVLFFFYLFKFGKTVAARKNGFAFGFASIVLLILFAFLFYGKINQLETEKYGVILAKEVSVRVSPDENAKTAFIIHEGLKIRLEDKVGEWINITLPDGKKGWAKSSVLEMI